MIYIKGACLGPTTNYLKCFLNSKKNLTSSPFFWLLLLKTTFYLLFQPFTNRDIYFELINHTSPPIRPPTQGNSSLVTFLTARVGSLGVHSLMNNMYSTIQKTWTQWKHYDDINKCINWFNIWVHLKRTNYMSATLGGKGIAFVIIFSSSIMYLSTLM